MPNADLISRMVESLAKDWPLVLALALIVRWGFPWALKAYLPGVLNTYFDNGGGQKVRSLVRAENEAQTQEHEARFRRIEDDLGALAGRRRRR